MAKFTACTSLLRPTHLPFLRLADLGWLMFWLSVVAAQAVAAIDREAVAVAALAVWCSLNLFRST